MKNKKIIIYDFDGTLTPYALPKFEILKRCGFANGSYDSNFLNKVSELSQKENIDTYNAFYQIYLSVIKDNDFKLVDENLCLGAENIEYNPGVVDFLKALNTNGIKNYLLSSGIKVFLNKTNIAPLFIDIYATDFNYNQNSEVLDIKFLMSDKNKVQAIKEICKINNNREDDCTNIIYIGDGLTDYYAMEYVKNNGGLTIFVYTDINNKDMKIIKEKDIVSFYELADFSINSELNNLILNLCDIKK